MAQEHGLGKMTMGQALDALDRDGSVGVHLVGLPTASGLTFGEFTYDSRAVMPTTLYACKGATFKEGYLRDAVDRGAAAYLAERAYDVDIPGLVVSDVRRAMAVLADGMGKQYGGKIASRIAVESFQDLFQDANAFYNPQYYFRKAFHRANQEILNQLDDGRGSASVAAVLLKNRKLYFASVGNVKIAVYRNGDLIPVTSGHTIQVLAKQKYMEGKLTRKEAVTMLHNHRLYNYVGQDDFHDVEFFDTPVSLYGGEYVVLMSDGLYEGTSWKSLEDCLAVEESCEKKALHMIELINQSEEKDKDNASVVLLRVD